MTSQRYAILDYLSIEGNHPTASDIYEHLKNEFPTMSVATVYNNLKFFIEAEIVNELPFGDGSSRFDLTVTNHYHAVCEVCGKVVDFDYPSLTKVEQEAERLTHFKVESHQFKVTGVCRDCQMANN